MDKREMIKRALDDLLEPDFEREEFAGINYDALAKQAIVIECEVEHFHSDKWSSSGMEIYFNDADEEFNVIGLDGHRGTPGKALAIIVPLEEE